MADLTRVTFEDARWALHELAGACRRMQDYKRAARIQKIADGMWPKGDIIPQPYAPRQNHG